MTRIPFSSERLRAILADKRTEIAQAVRDFSDGHSRLRKFLGVDELLSEQRGILHSGGKLSSDERRRGDELMYVLDVLSAYALCDPSKRRSRMEVLAENYHNHPDNAKEILEYFGLEM